MASIKNLTLVILGIMMVMSYSQAQGTGWDDSEVVDTNQFMTIPLSQQWLEHKGIDYEISEGWLYSTGEQEIHSLVNHKSVDYAVPHGTPVYAPVDGWIQGSYYNTTLGAVGSRTLHEGKPINYGLGYWVQIVYPDPKDPLNPEKVTLIQLAHLSRFAPKVAQTIRGKEYIFDPVEDALKINNYSLTSQQLKLILKGWKRDVIRVKKGELIGYAGNSGLERGEEIVPGYQPKTSLRDPQNSRDESHVHVQIYNRSVEGYKIPASIKDLYNLGTGLVTEYPTHTNGLGLTSGHLFVSTDGKLPDYAR